MSLKITRASDPIEVKTIVACIYAVPGLGKTSLGFTAEKPLLFDFDHGAHRSGNRRDCVIAQGWEDVANITAADVAPFKTLVLDTAGRALDMLSIDIIAADPKAGRGGALTLQGYGTLKSRFISWLKLMRSFGLDVVLLCHSNEERKGDDLIERLDMQGGSKGEVYKAADLMGREYLEKGKRVLNFNPTDVAFGKNPAHLEPEQVPDFAESPDYLATVITRTKAALNKLTAKQTEVAATMTEWKKRVDAAASATDFDALVAAAKEAPDSVRDNVKRLIVKGAKAEGWAWNKDTGAFDMAPKESAKGTKQQALAAKGAA
jgi:hypothetical protein